MWEYWSIVISIIRSFTKNTWLTLYIWDLLCSVLLKTKTYFARNVASKTTSKEECASSYIATIQVLEHICCMFLQWGLTYWSSHFPMITVLLSCYVWNEKQLTVSLQFNSFELQQATLKISLHLIHTCTKRLHLYAPVAEVFNVAHIKLQLVSWSNWQQIFLICVNYSIITDQFHSGWLF